MRKQFWTLANNSRHRAPLTNRTAFCPFLFKTNLKNVNKFSFKYCFYNANAFTAVKLVYTITITSNIQLSNTFCRNGYIRLIFISRFRFYRKFSNERKLKHFRKRKRECVLVPEIGSFFFVKIYFSAFLREMDYASKTNTLKSKR